MRIDRTIKFVVVALCTAMFTAACDSSSSTNISDPSIGSGGNEFFVPGLWVNGLSGRAAVDIKTPWVADVYVSENSSNTESIEVRTIRRAIDWSLKDEVDLRRKEFEFETCVSADSIAQSSGGSFASAGASVRIEYAEGVWLTIDLDERQQLYRSVGELGRMPTGSYVEIDIDVIPATGGIALVQPNAPVREWPPYTEALTNGSANYLDETFVWEKDSDDNSFIVLDFLQYDFNDNYLGLKVKCYLIDDGTFDLPAATKTLLANYSGSGNYIRSRFERRVRALSTRDSLVFAYTSIGVRE